MSRRVRILVAVGLAAALASAGAAAHRRAAQGFSTPKGWGPVALSVAPNGTRAAFTGTPDASTGGVTPSGTRVTLDDLPDAKAPFRDGFVVY